MKSLTFNDEQICNGMSLKVEAMVLSSIVILFGRSWRLSLKWKSFLTESRRESEKYLGLSQWTILYPLAKVKCLDKKGIVRRLSEEDRSLVEIKWNGICLYICNYSKCSLLK